MAKETKSLATAPKQVVTTALDYGQDAGAGFENQTRSDLSIPFITVLQPMSPQVTNMEGAKPGMLFNTVTEELSKTVTIVPAVTDHTFVEWIPRDKGGGFVAAHAVDSDVVKAARAASKEFGHYKTPAGNELSETFYVYAVVLDAQGQPDGMAVLGFTSTKISVYKRWNTKVNMFTLPMPDGRKVRPPLFAHKVVVSTTKEKNNKGEFFNFDLQPANGDVRSSLLPPGHAALEAAKELRTMVTSGMAKAAYDTTGADASAGQGDPDWNA